MTFAAIILIFAASSVATGQEAYIIPAGTRVRLRMDDEISTRFSSVNDTFRARVAEAIKVRGIISLPAGVVMVGRVTGVSRPAPGGRNGRLDFRIETLLLSDRAERTVEGIPVTTFPGRRPGGIWRTLGFSAAGAAIGAALGSLRGGIIGAGIGAGGAQLVPGKDVQLKEDDIFEIELNRPVSLPVTDN